MKLEPQEWPPTLPDSFLHRQGAWLKFSPLRSPTKPAKFNSHRARNHPLIKGKNEKYFDDTRENDLYFSSGSAGILIVLFNGIGWRANESLLIERCRTLHVPVYFEFVSIGLRDIGSLDLEVGTYFNCCAFGMNKPGSHDRRC